jgi:hypothetical protein
MRQPISLLLALAIAACAKQDEGEKLAKDVTSWSATLQLVADARLRHEAGAGFATKSIDAAIEDLTTEAAAPSLPDSVSARAKRVIGAAGELRQAIASDDRAGIVRARRALAAEAAESQ